MDYKIEALNDIQTSNRHYLIEVKKDDSRLKISSLLGILHIIALTIESAATIYMLIFLSPYSFFHIFALVFGIMYQMNPSISSNIIYRVLVNLTSSIYIMLFIFNIALKNINKTN